MEVKVSSEALRTSDREGNCSVNKNREFSRRDKFDGRKMMSVFLPNGLLSARWAFREKFTASSKK